MAPSGPPPASASAMRGFFRVLLMRGSLGTLAGRALCNAARREKRKGAEAPVHCAIAGYAAFRAGRFAAGRRAAFFAAPPLAALPFADIFCTLAFNSSMRETRASISRDV